jgi:hypothetical protein
LEILGRHVIGSHNLHGVEMVTIVRRTLSLTILFVAGCSTAPVADVLDFFKPSRLGAERTPPYGGVCAPTPGGAAVAVPAIPAVGPIAPPPAVIVPPAPVSPPTTTTPPLTIRPPGPDTALPASIPSSGGAPDLGGPR